MGFGHQEALTTQFASDWVLHPCTHSDPHGSILPTISSGDHLSPAVNETAEGAKSHKLQDGLLQESGG